MTWRQPRTKRLAIAAAAAIAVCAPLGSARAQSAEAEALFQEGKRLMKKGAIAAACDKFEAGDRIEPTAGNELNLARCREKNGQLATAWATYLKAAAAARHTGDARREAEARKQAAALESQLVYLTIAVPGDGQTPGLVIKRNDAAVDPGVWNQRVPVDPDEYTVSAEAPGYQPWSTAVVVKTKSKKVDVPALVPRPEARRGDGRRGARARTADDAEPAAAGDTAGAGDSGDGHRTAEAAPGRWTAKRKLALGFAAVGVVAAGAGIGLGLHANSVESQADAQCPGAVCDKQAAVDLNHTARSYALAANLGFAVAGAAIATACALWFLGAPAHDPVAVAPMLDAGRVGVSFARAF